MAFYTRPANWSGDPILQVLSRPAEHADAATPDYVAHVLTAGGTTAVAVAGDGSCWLCSPNGQRAPLAMQAQQVRTVRGGLFFAGHGSLGVWDATTWQPLHQVATQCAINRLIATARSAVVETPTCELVRVDLTTGKHDVLPWLFADEREQPLLSFCCDDEGRWLAAVHPNMVRIWDLASPIPASEPLATIAIAESYGGFVQFLRDQLFVYGITDGWQVLDPTSGQAVGSWPIGVDPREPLTTGLGGTAIACLQGTTLAVVAAATGSPLYGFDVGPMENVSLSADERLLVGWCDTELAVWDVATGAVVGRWHEADRIRNAQVDGAIVTFVDPSDHLIFLSIP